MLKERKESKEKWGKRGLVFSSLDVSSPEKAQKLDLSLQKDEVSIAQGES